MRYWIMDLDTANLWAQGYAVLPRLVTPAQCHSIRNLYAEERLFRSRIDMKRYRFGQGEYQYFAYPLPEEIAGLRIELYASLVPVARDWMKTLSVEAEFPGTLDEFLQQCHQAGQARPTPLLLRYREGDYNCLHQDLYGKLFFPFQVVIGLSESGREYTGGELLLVEQQPRAQSIGRVVPLAQGDGAVITTRYRPGRSAKGFYRANVRHGVSSVRSGERYTMGLIFHDAE
jgi:uncharacterized protein